MRLMSAKRFAAKYFDEGEGPDKRTVKAWVEKGIIAGRMVGTHAYVDADAWEQSTGNPLADKILNRPQLPASGRRARQGSGGS